MNIQSTGPWGCGSCQAFLRLISLWLQSTKHIKCGWGQGGYYFTLVVCCMNVLWITFLFTNSVSIKCILLIKLTCYNNNQRFYLPKDAITHMLRVCVWTSGHSLHTHLHPYRLLRPLQDTGSLISWQALNKAPTVLKTDKCDDLSLMAEENVTK